MSNSYDFYEFFIHSTLFLDKYAVFVQKNTLSVKPCGFDSSPDGGALGRPDRLCWMLKAV